MCSTVTASSQTGETEAWDGGMTQAQAGNMPGPVLRPRSSSLAMQTRTHMGTHIYLQICAHTCTHKYAH